MRYFIEQMIVDGANFKTRRTQVFHNRTQFRFCKNQVAHNHSFVVIARKRSPGAKCKSRLDLDASNRHMEVGARETQSVNVSSLLSRAAHRFVNLGIVQTLRRQDARTQEENRNNENARFHKRPLSSGKKSSPATIYYPPETSLL